jgi:hypothetical protein
MKKKDKKYIEKNISPFYYKKPNKIEFKDILYTVCETERIPVDQLEKCHV